MIKKSFKPGDQVVFAQHYFNTGELARLYNKTGTVIVCNPNLNRITVVWDTEEDAACPEPVPGARSSTYTGEMSDFEFYVENPDDLDDLAEHDELAGLGRAQLIQEKLQAQENDPELDTELTKLINQN